MKKVAVAIALGIAVQNVALAENPESLAVGSQLYDTGLLIETVGAANAIPVSEMDSRDAKILDRLDELMMRASSRIAVLLRETPDEHWASQLTKPQWAERLILQYLNHHADSSANEGWAVVCQLCLFDKKATSDLFVRLKDDQQLNLLDRLKSGNNAYKREACAEFAAMLEKLR